MSTTIKKNIIIKLWIASLIIEVAIIIGCVWYEPQYVSGLITQQKLVVTSLIGMLFSAIGLSISINN
jgi:hypothetical protein